MELLPIEFDRKLRESIIILVDRPIPNPDEIIQIAILRELDKIRQLLENTSNGQRES